MAREELRVHMLWDTLAKRITSCSVNVPSFCPEANLSAALKGRSQWLAGMEVIAFHTTGKA
jgi:hypothetical protein